MLKINRLEPFKCKNSEFEFLGCDIYSDNNLSFLINSSNASTILIKEDILKNLYKHELDENLKFKLVQRGLATFKNIHTNYTKLQYKYIPKHFCIEITQNCNLRCKYCFRDFKNPTQNTMSEKMIEKICNYIIRYCKKNKINHILIQPWGGEPLLCLDKILIIKKCFDDSGISTQITVETNGTLITLEMAKTIHENNINIGISLDGPEKIQNFQRTYHNDKPTFEDIVKGIKNLNKVGHSFGILTVITNYSSDIVEDILDFFVKELKCNNMRLNMIHPSKDNIYNMTFDTDKADFFSDKLINKLVSLNEEGHYVTESNVKTQLENLLVDTSGGFCKMQGCQYGKLQVAFDSKGNIYPCELTQYSEEILGNVENEDDLDCLISNSNKKQSFFIKVRENQCKECSFWYGCRGGCSSAVKYMNNPNVNIDLIQCSINRSIYPKLIELILNKPSIVEKLIKRKINFIY
ncbi:MAG: radical SAM protein [Endomicrobium sp.]|jgi:uncharacterized protein|nr:radical SAM protein [Endomicrobium sp.]